MDSQCYVVACDAIKFNDKQNRLELGDIFGNEYLTLREVEVLKYVILGYTAKRIALKLNISFRTVETYIANLKFKLRCNTKAEIIERVIKMKLVELLSIQLLVKKRLSFIDYNIGFLIAEDSFYGFAG